MNSIQVFLWWCAGARIDLLKQDEFKDDRAKYFGIGGTILFTALMASFAGGYAFFTAFKAVSGVEKYLGLQGQQLLRETYTQGSYITAVLFGAFWGALIFNLDRYIVSTIKDDGKPTISWTELLNAFPRLVLALILGLVISLPVELKIYEKEINVEIHNLIREKQAELLLADSTIINEKARLEDSLIYIAAAIEKINSGASVTIQGSRVSELKAAIPPLEKADKDAKEKETKERNAYNRAYNKYINDTTKKKPSRTALNQAEKKSKEAEAKLKKAREDLAAASGEAFDENKSRIEKLQNKQETIEIRITKLQEIIDKHREEYENVANQYTGFMASCLAFERLRKKEMDVLIKSLFLTFLFIFIEIAPVLFKLMTESGNYDTAIKTNRSLFIDACESKLNEFNQKAQTDARILAEKNKTRLDAELKGNQELLSTISSAQSEIAIKAVEKWKKQELERLEHSIEHIINSNQSESVSFQNKFWILEDVGDEYFFRNGNNNELIIRNPLESKSGKWKYDGSELDIELEGNIKTYKIGNLNQDVFEIHHTDSKEYLKFKIG